MINPKRYNDMVDDIRCKENSVKPITRRVCRNNCRYWDRYKNKCKRGY